MYSSIKCILNHCNFEKKIKMDLEKKVQYLYDRIAIQDTIAMYSLGQDTHQGDDRNVLEQWKTAFTPDATVDFTVFGIPPCSYQELATHLRGDENQKGKMNEAFSKWQHLLGLPTVILHGDEATSRTDLWASHNGRSIEKVPQYSVYAAGVFHDQLIRTDEGWRIKFRRLEMHFIDTINTAPNNQG